MQLKMTVESDGEKTVLDGMINELVIAGWTGRDQDALDAHIRELEEIGVARPAKTPTYYRVSSSLLTTANVIEVSGETSSGEVEFVLFALERELYIGLGSDHTDREAEKIGVTLSKQLCPKPVCGRIWKFEDIADHWDELVLRSYANIDGKKILYQEGSVTAMREPVELMQNYLGRSGSPQSLAMFCGTLAVNGGIRAADEFSIELEDPVLGRKLSHTYTTISLPIAG